LKVAVMAINLSNQRFLGWEILNLLIVFYI
jgi:hypothetical protein